MLYTGEVGPAPGHSRTHAIARVSGLAQSYRPWEVFWARNSLWLVGVGRRLPYAGNSQLGYLLVRASRRRSASSWGLEDSRYPILERYLEDYYPMG